MMSFVSRKQTRSTGCMRLGLLLGLRLTAVFSFFINLMIVCGQIHPFVCEMSASSSSSLNFLTYRHVTCPSCHILAAYFWRSFSSAHILSSVCHGKTTLPPLDRWTYGCLCCSFAMVTVRLSFYTAPPARFSSHSLLFTFPNILACLHFPFSPLIWSPWELRFSYVWSGRGRYISPCRLFKRDYSHKASAGMFMKARRFYSRQKNTRPAEINRRDWLSCIVTSPREGEMCWKDVTLWFYLNE